MKKEYINISLKFLLILLPIFLLVKPFKTNKINIEPVSKDINVEINESEIKETQEECEAINNPLSSKTSENGYPIHNSEGPITEEKLKEIIDHQLTFLVYKKNYQEITNKDLFYQALMDKNINYEDSFTKEDLEKSLEKTVLSNLKLKHESHYSETGYNYIYKNGIYTADDSNQAHVDAYDEYPIYGEVQTFEEKNRIYKITIKYLWVAGNYEPTTALYKNEYDAKKKINKIEIPNKVECYSKWIKDNFKKYEKDLPTYTYSFKEINNHIYLVDYYITEKK